MLCFSDLFSLLIILNSTLLISADCVDGLTNYWKMNEGTGSNAYDSVSVYHGAINGASWSSIAKVGDSLNFDDTGELPLCVL